MRFLTTLIVAFAGVMASSQIAIGGPVLKVTVLNVTNPFAQAGAGFGESVAGIGDVSGDGVADLVVGSPGANRVYVISGATRTVIRTITDPNGTGHRFGYTVANAGDVDGDGFDDVAAGAPGPVPAPLGLPCVVQPCPVPDAAYGRAFVFSGDDGTLIHTVNPAEDFAGFGVSVGSLGDVTGDGVPDLAVGMTPFGVASSFGRVYAFSGGSNALLWKTDEPGGKQTPSFGLRIASITDLNGDGRRDLLVSAPFHDTDPDPNVYVLAGQVYVLSGSTGAVFRTHTNSAPADNNLFGSAVAALGDQNGDGSEDYAIGEAGKGVVHLISGKTGAQSGTLSAPASGDSFGLTIAAVGDQDGDNHSDFWVGAPGSGKAYLMKWSGATLAIATDPALPGPISGGFGWSMAGTGNLGGDSPGDLIVGKPGTASGSGAAFIVLLAANKPPIAKAGPDQTIECVGPAGTSIVLDGTASTDPDGDTLSYEWRDGTNAIVGTTAIVHLTVVGLGVHTFTLKVSDGIGGTDTDSLLVSVRDTTPPSLTVSLVPAQLWPPDHRLIPITALMTATDACDGSPSIQLVSIESSESDNGLGDGDTVGDIQEAAVGTKDGSFLLRAERSGAGSGRVYTATYRATDASLNAALATATVVVPH
jgi:hypothetical protein